MCYPAELPDESWESAGESRIENLEHRPPRQDPLRTARRTCGLRGPGWGPVQDGRPKARSKSNRDESRRCGIGCADPL